MPTPGTLSNGLPAGLGTPDEAMQATAWVRQQPWYQDFLKQYGVQEGPNQQVQLTDTQRAALMATMLQHGIGLNSKYDSVDQNGMIAEEHHKLKKAAIAAAIGGLALTGFGAAGIGPLAGALSGAGAAGAGGTAATSGLTEGGLLASSAIPAVSATGALVPAGVGTGALISGGGAAAAAGASGAALGASGAASSTPAWLKAVQAGGQLASDIGAGRAKGRVDESNINNNADRTALDLYRTQIAANADENNYGLSSAGMANSYGLSSVNAGLGIGNLDLAQKNYALDAPGKRAGNAVRGDILANAQDVTIDGPSTIPKTTISGGLRPSMFSNNTRQLGGLMSSQALDQQQAGDTFAPLPKVPAFTPPPAYKPPPGAPTLTGPAQSNGFDTGLNIAGYAGLGADLLSKYAKYFK